MRNSIMSNNKYLNRKIIKVIKIPQGISLSPLIPINTDKSNQLDERLKLLLNKSMWDIEEDFYHSVTVALADWLGVAAVVLGKIVPDNKIEVLAMQLDGKAVENYVYDLAGTPCNNVRNEGICCYPDNITRLFPKDKDLIDMQAEGYIGVPLKNRAGDVLGVLCAISRNKISLPPDTEELLTFIAARAALEIERKLAKDELIDKTQKLGERIKELEGLKKLNELCNKKSVEIEKVLKILTKEIIPASMQFPEYVWSEIVIDGISHSACGNIRKRTDHFLKASLVINGKQRGEINMGYIDKSLPFIPLREQDLIENYAYILSAFIANKELNQSLIQAKDAAEKANAAKTEFLSSMSHELRTPLNAVIGFSDMMLKDGNFSKKYQKYLTYIKGGGDHLLGLISDILDLGSIEAGKLELEQIPFDLKELLDQVKVLMEKQATVKGLQFEFKTDYNIPELQGDSLRIKQVIINLVANAIKFTERGKVTIEIRVKNNTADSITLFFAIKDTGIGIAENKINEIWNSFMQADNSISRKYGGSGLGLDISQKLVGLMGGHIQVASTLGKGSTFSFTIDLKKTVVQNSRAITQVHNNWQQNLTILVVDDVDINRELLGAMLEQKNTANTVLFAENGEQALQIVREKNKEIDLIFMDIKLPDMSGYEVTEKLIAQGIKIPIIAQTANALKEDQEKCISSGMAGYISKPITMQGVAEIIGKIFPDNNEDYSGK